MLDNDTRERSAAVSDVGLAGDVAPNRRWAPDGLSGLLAFGETGNDDPMGGATEFDHSHDDDDTSTL